MTTEAARAPIAPGMTIQVMCSRATCREWITWTIPENNWWAEVPHFHSRSCGKRMKREMASFEAFPGCPYPNKRGHRTIQEALVHVKALSLSDGRLYRSYRCECGSIHVGHASVRLLSPDAR